MWAWKHFHLIQFNASFSIIIHNFNVIIWVIAWPLKIHIVSLPLCCVPNSGNVWAGFAFGYATFYSEPFWVCINKLYVTEIRNGNSMFSCRLIDFRSMCIESHTHLFRSNFIFRTESNANKTNEKHFGLDTEWNIFSHIYSAQVCAYC